MFQHDLIKIITIKILSFGTFMSEQIVWNKVRLLLTMCHFICSFWTLMALQNQTVLFIIILFIYLGQLMYHIYLAIRCFFFSH